MTEPNKLKGENLMIEDVDLKENTLPEEETKTGVLEDTIPNENEIFVPIKYNKQVLNLSLSEAGELAQKGKKFEEISNDYEQIKLLARKEDKSVAEYIAALKQSRDNKILEELTNECGGNREMALRVLELSNKNETTERLGFNELRESFPQYENIDSLPQEVVEKAKLKGTLLLDEYLRYLLKEKTITKQTIEAQRDAENNSIGSQINKKSNLNPETVEFLKGLWK